MAATTEKHPRGLYVLFGTEMWERYSFYTVGAMLSLYLRDTTEGFSFSPARSASVAPWELGLGSWKLAFGRWKLIRPTVR